MSGPYSCGASPLSDNCSPREHRRWRGPYSEKYCAPQAKAHLLRLRTHVIRANAPKSPGKDSRHECQKTGLTLSPHPHDRHRRACARRAWDEGRKALRTGLRQATRTRQRERLPGQTTRAVEPCMQILQAACNSPLRLRGVLNSPTRVPSRIRARLHVCLASLHVFARRKNTSKMRGLRCWGQEKCRLDPEEF